MFKNYYEVRDWLESFIPQAYTKENLRLERIEYLLKLLGNPQEKFKSIHVAGTSGKGSTAFYIAKLLLNCKPETRNQKPETIRIGLHTSPHLVDIRERMQIFAGSQCFDPVSENLNEAGSSLMPMRRFIELFSDIKPVVESMKGSKVGSPSYFEILVAASFFYFADEKVGWAVVEVGLGGRLDATNVLQPLITLITNVDLDHTDILGNSIEKIAYEKAGIIKKNVPVVTTATGRALKIIKKVAAEKRSELITINTHKIQNGPKFDIFESIAKPSDTFGYTHKNFALPNLLLAMKAVQALKVTLSKEQIWEAFQANFPGRLEQIDEGVVLDGAHNADKIKYLINFVISNFQSPISNQKNTLRAKRKRSREVVELVSSRQARTINSITLVVSFKKGKDWQKMVDLLLKNLPVAKIIATRFVTPTDTGLFEAIEPEEIARYVLSMKYHVSCMVVDNSQEAVFEALNLDSSTWQVKDSHLEVNRIRQELVLATGSLYLVGEARTLWYLPQF